MSLLQKAMDGARNEDEIAAAQAIAALSEDPQEAAQADFSTDPLTGYDAAQIALRLFENRRLVDFAMFLKDNNLSPNIVLPNGLTLLQNSLFRYPKDEARIELLLTIGANPNLFMRKIEEEGFASSTHRAAYHPLNYAFAHCPQLTTPEVCRVLRKFGASAEGLRNYFEVDPAVAITDDEEKAALRKELIAAKPEAELTALVRKDVDLSVMQKHMANVETQLAAAGFQIVSYVPPRQQKPRALGSDVMIPIFENFHIVTNQQIKTEYTKYQDIQTCVRALCGYDTNLRFSDAHNYFPSGSNKLGPMLTADLTSDVPQEVFGWLPQGASAGTIGQNKALATLKPEKLIIIRVIGQKKFSCLFTGVYKDKNNTQFFYDPSVNGIRILSGDDKQVSLTERNDIMDGLDTSINFAELNEFGGSVELKFEQKVVKIDTNHRPIGSAPAFDAGISPPNP